MTRFKGLCESTNLVLSYGKEREMRFTYLRMICSLFVFCSFLTGPLILEKTFWTPLVYILHIASIFLMKNGWFFIWINFFPLYPWMMTFLLSLVEICFVILGTTDKEHHVRSSDMKPEQSYNKPAENQIFSVCSSV